MRTGRSFETGIKRGIDDEFREIRGLTLIVKPLMAKASSGKI
jgi:hypothetical protein